MRPLSELKNHGIRFVFTDIDGTLTEGGRLPESSYSALWKLYNSGVQIIPVTGRPAGWCEMIARLWPVSGVIGENGALYYRYHNSKMLRHYAVKPAQMLKNRKKLDQLRKKILKAVPKAAVASDQFTRLFDLAIDFAEDVGPLPKAQVQKIAELFKKQGATAKVSSIHVNGWFGRYDKLSMCRTFCKKVLGFEFAQNQAAIAFIGDSPNDEPMFAAFENSFAVANIQDFKDELEHLPTYVTKAKEAAGFVEFSEQLIK